MKLGVLLASIGLAAVYLLGPGCPDGNAAESDQILDRVRLLIDSGQHVAARDLLMSYISSGVEQSDYAVYLLALSSFSDTDPEAAHGVVETMRQRYPKSRFLPMAMYRLAQFYRHPLRDPERAISVYSQLLQNYPQDSLAREAYLGLSSSLIDAGHYDRAIATLHQALGLYDYLPQERNVLNSLLEFAKQNTGQLATGGVVVDVRSPEEKPVEVKIPPAMAEAPVAEVRWAERGMMAETPQRPSEPVWTVPLPSPYRMPEDDTNPSVLMNFRRAFLDDVLNYMAEKLCVTFIIDEEVQTRLTIINPCEVGGADAIELLRTALELNGMVMERTANLYKIYPAGKMKKWNSEQEYGRPAGPSGPPPPWEAPPNTYRSKPRSSGRRAIIK